MRRSIVRRVLVTIMWVSLVSLSVLTVTKFLRFESDVYTAGGIFGFLAALIVSIVGLITYKNK